MVQAGKYVCKKKMQVIKELSTITAKNPQTGSVERVYGTWATTPDNLIVFEPEKPVVLSQQQVEMPHIRNLIENGTLTRVY